MMSLYFSFLPAMVIILFSKKAFWSELSYYFFMAIFYILSLLPLGLGFKMVGYNVGLDNMSLSLNILSLWVTILMVYSSTLIFKNKSSDGFFLVVLMVLLLTLLISFFSMNLFMFYFFFEFSLIPTLILIMGWGYQPERVQAGIYFLFYTLMASLPLLLSLFYIYMSLGSLYLYLFEGMDISSGLSVFFFLAMVMAFLVKMPMFMTHLWLPKAHVEAPVSGSMILAGVLLKLGGFGLCRVMGLIYVTLMKVSSYFIGLSLMGMVYVGFICCRLNDMKALIAYSSVSHMAMVISGIFSYYIWGFSGALSMMIAHGISSSGLFCSLNMYYERSHSRSIFLNKGLMLISSSMTLMFFMLCIANISAPPTINLFSEILLMASIMSFDFFMVIVFPLGSFLGAVFTFYIFSFTQHGKSFLLLSGKLNFTFKELNVLMMHIVPLNLIIIVPDMFLLF